MTTIQHPVADRHNERGVALLSVLLLMVLISALSGALVISGRTELLLARNHQAAAQAEAAAEAGLNHAMQVTLAKLLTWKSDGFGSIGLAATALLVGPDGLTGSVATDADNGSLATYGIPDAGITLTGVLNSSYQVRLMDEDDPARGTVPSNITVAPVSEDNNPYADLNGRILVRSTGVARDNTTVTLEAMIGPADPPAIVTNCTSPSPVTWMSLDREAASTRTAISRSAVAPGSIRTRRPAVRPAIPDTMEGSWQVDSR